MSMPRSSVAARVAAAIVLTAMAGLGEIRAQQPAGGTARPPAPPFELNDARPGQSERLPRAWEGQPPLVPHSLKGLVPITPTTNACVRCHGRAGATSGPPPAPTSHFVDGRDPAAGTLPRIAGARWNCTACHVAQTNAPPFVSAFPAVAPPRSLVPGH